MPRITVSIVSDDRISSEGLRRIITSDDSFRLVAVPERLPLAPEIHAANPDALLLDARMQNSLALCRHLRLDGDRPAVVFFAVPDDEAAAIDALAAGARGILQRSARPEDIAKAVRLVSSGQVWAPRHVIVSAWLGDMKQASNGKHTVDAPAEPRLTAREMEVLHHAAAGLGNKEVADTLSITEATVKAHLTRIFQKLGLHGRARLAAAYHGVHAPASVRHGQHSASRTA